LEDTGATLQANPQLFETIVTNATKYTYHFEIAFTALKNAGATPQLHESLFKIAIEYAQFAKKLKFPLTALINAGITPPEDFLPLHEEAIKNAYGITIEYKFTEVFTVLANIGAT